MVLYSGGRTIWILHHQLEHKIKSLTVQKMIALQSPSTALFGLHCTSGTPGTPQSTFKIWWVGTVTEEGCVQHDGGASCNSITI
jgi:hypothetical protein